MNLGREVCRRLRAADEARLRGRMGAILEPVSPLFLAA
jgi:hypothetical protein